MDWKEIGFNSEEEMNASIERVQRARRNPPSEIRQGIENQNRLRENIDEHGRLDLNAISEGARLNELDKEVERRMYWEEQARQDQKRTDEINALLKKAAQSTTADNQAKAAAKIQEETERTAKEIRLKHLKEQGVKSDEEISLDNSYRGLLEGLKRKE